MAVIHRVKANQGNKQANIGLRNVLADHVALFAQTLLNPVECFPHELIRGLISFLGTCKTTAIHTVINCFEDVVVDLLHFIGKLLRIQIRRTLALEILPTRDEIAHDRWVIIGHNATGGFLHDGRNRNAARVIREALEISVLQAWNLKHRVNAAFVQVELPGTHIVGRAGQRQRDGIFQAHQATRNNGAVCPRASTGNGQTVTASFLWPVESAVCLLRRFANAGDNTVLDVIGIAHKFAVGGGVACFLERFLGVAGCHGAPQFIVLTCQQRYNKFRHKSRSTDTKGGLATWPTGGNAVARRECSLPDGSFSPSV